MTRVVPILALALALAACGNSTAPSPLYSTYFLASIDGQPLPAADQNAPTGATVLNAWLGFSRDGRPREADPPVAVYTRTLRLPDQSEHTATTSLLYTVSKGELRINLCPPGSACLVPSELIGFANRDEMVLTHHLGGELRSVYRFVAAMPD